MKALALGIASACVLIALVLGAAVPGGAAGSGTPPNWGHDRSHEMPRSQPLPADPANCTQGSHSIYVKPTPGDMREQLLDDYTTLGQEGGGTLFLAPGVFQLNETLNLARYSNVSFQGSGMGRTIISLPPTPIGTFTSDNGTPVGQYNSTIGGPVNGTDVNLIQVSGSTPVNDFGMCDLTLNAQANSASEDWAGSLIMDISGGFHHVYSDISEVGFFGPSTTPNGLHLESAAAPGNVGVGYVIDHLVASNNTVPFTTYPGYRGGPNFLNVGAVSNCTLDDVVGTGLAAFEVSPPHACLIEDWNVTGHILIDPTIGGSWDDSVFQNVTVDSRGTASPNVLDIDVANGSSNGGSNFTQLRWNDSRFYGNVLDAANMVDVENSTFEGGLNATPSFAYGDTVVYDPNSSQNGIPLPIRADGIPSGGASSFLFGDTFLFPNGTGKYDPFLLTVPEVSWTNDTVGIGGSTNGYLLNAPGVAIAAYSTFSGLTYDAVGGGAPSDLVLFDIVGSSGYQDLGAVVGSLARIYDDLPVLIPTEPGDLTGTATSPTVVDLAWSASSGPVTNYTVWLRTASSGSTTSFSAGLQTSYDVEGLSPASPYYFSVQAWNSSWHSPVSPSVELTTPPPPERAPGVPTGIAIFDVGATELGIRWTASTGEVTNYTVLTGVVSGILNSSYAVGNDTHFNVTGLHPETKYFLAVEAWNGSWSSGHSAPLNATTLTTPTSPPPTNPSPPVTHSTSPGPLSWPVLLATIFGAMGAVVLPLLLIGLVRARSRVRKVSAARTAGTDRTGRPARDSGRTGPGAAARPAGARRSSADPVSSHSSLAGSTYR